MTRLLFLLFPLTFLFTQVSAEVITFDEFETNIETPQLNLYDPNYHGFTWSDNFGVVNGLSLPNTGFFNGVVSEPNVALNGFAQDVVISSDQPFVFEGAYFASSQDTDIGVQFFGYLDGTLLFDGSKRARFSEPSFLDMPFVTQRNDIYIDKLILGSSVNGVPFVMDNFTYYRDVGAVPEPSSLTCISLSLLSLLGVGYRRYRKQN